MWRGCCGFLVVCFVVGLPVRFCLHCRCCWFGLWFWFSGAAVGYLGLIAFGCLVVRFGIS